MNILVILKMVPDIVEELEVTPDGRTLDAEFLRMKLSESDEHALEEALLIKERHGGKVAVLAPDAPEVDDALFTALAKGADRVLKIPEIDSGSSTRRAARAVAQVICGTAGLRPVDLVLTGTQAIDDLDGLLAPHLAHLLGLPYLGIVTRITLDASGSTASLIKEYPGSMRAEFEVPLPAVVGIQAAEKPPRYVPVAKVRAAMKSQQIESAPVPTLADGGVELIQIHKMAKPVVAGHAEMLEGSPEDIAQKVCDILTQRGLV